MDNVQKTPRQKTGIDYATFGSILPGRSLIVEATGMCRTGES